MKRAKSQRHILAAVTAHRKISVSILSQEFENKKEFKRIIRMKAALLLIFSNSYQFTTVCKLFSNSHILDKKKKANGRLQLLSLNCC